ncbi:plasmid mobilization protein [Pedobacter insulae]|uniref:Mobilisation protein (MobC) n=1 Tax=Pedobacter insulae TaxID=414048 RepID=A0A1I2Z5S7_9SPHI|nr:plasmid mobilization relaxosome protein MobC [Pedobacter insulae]SFH33203.1 mobilisation protein (MobC) [Pedobacter insulae]
MPRRKSADPEKILSRVLRIRLTDAAFKRLEKISKSSDCHTVGEAARKILSKEKITLFYKDISLNSTMEELALIRKELRAIGININQITKAFHSDKRETPQMFQVTKVTMLYEKVEAKTDTLLILINKLAEKWLPRS